MKKRQKKKNAKNAIINLIEGEATAKDWHIAKTYGREYFQKEIGFPPELLNLNLSDLFDKFKRVMVDMLKDVGNAFINMGENMYRVFEDQEEAE